MGLSERPVALITGGSRGIGAATALALADRGHDIVITYRNKATRAAEVAGAIAQRGKDALSIACDMTQQESIDQLFASVREWRGRLDLLILNAAGGLERDLLAADPQYAMRINRDAQLAAVDAALDLMDDGGGIVFVTSHWAHLYGRIEQLPIYLPVAETKYAGEQALRGRLAELAARNIRLLVVTGDMVEGTIAPKLLERSVPGVLDGRRDVVGALPTPAEMGEAIAAAATDATLPNGHTVVVGGTLESVPFRQG